MRNNAILYSVLIAGFVTTHLKGQQSALSAGGDASGTGGSMNYSVGQVFYIALSGTGGSSNQGVQQAFEISVINSLNDENSPSLNYSVYPNPSLDYITLKTDSQGNEHMETITFELLDATGKILNKGKVATPEESINMKGYSNAVYFLALKKDNLAFKTFKIIKNN